ncbi:hypothetical protein HELRODRAFT_180248 [Helobdella robusta]|uniref:Uncharacterized protein n=1 Tax=Helobdella robusta TaxID=6412 RepID=T1FFM6_HELRO|nr:hypothetical protein HELRODRAFT_180248 [Helobdella robusta]ESN94080.1 hypothetical protein HELRODRAFT_180248 [Helobdella robusta]
MYKLMIICINILTVFYAHARCFTRFATDGKCFCACDSPFSSTKFSMVSAREAVLLCSMRCSQTADCVAYNFIEGSNQCQLFNQTSKTFSLVPNCQHFTNHDRLQKNRTLLITADNILTEFYVNGKSISVNENFPHATSWDILDTYALIGPVYVIAVLSRNTNLNGGLIAKTLDGYILTNSTWECTNDFHEGWYRIDYDDSSWPDAKHAKQNAEDNVLNLTDAVWIVGGLIAKTLDNYILTNSTWRCTNNTYDGWYEVGYDDSDWPAAVVGKREKDKKYFVKNFKPAQWITDESDCKSCASNFYCRKNFKDVAHIAHILLPLTVSEHELKIFQ